MLCIAPGVLTLSVLKEKVPIYDDQGRMVHAGRRNVSVQFIQGGTIPDYAKREALGRLRFSGLPEHLDPLTQICWLDTDMAADQYGWTAEEKKLVEEKLQSWPDQSSFIIVSKPKLPAPWPKYDSLVVQGRRTIEKVVEQIVETVETVGYSPAEVAAYEAENLNRKPVLDALAGLSVSGGDSVEDEEPLIAA